MKERVIVYGSFGYKEWAYWIDTIVTRDTTAMVILNGHTPQTMAFGSEIQVVADELTAQRMVDEDRAQYEAQSSAEHARYMRENFPHVRQ